MRSSDNLLIRSHVFTVGVITVHLVRPMKARRLIITPTGRPGTPRFKSVSQSLSKRWWLHLVGDYSTVFNHSSWSLQNEAEGSKWRVCNRWKWQRPTRKKYNQMRPYGLTFYHHCRFNIMTNDCWHWDSICAPGWHDLSHKLPFACGESSIGVIYIEILVLLILKSEMMSFKVHSWHQHRLLMNIMAYDQKLQKSYWMDLKVKEGDVEGKSTVLVLCKKYIK